jgi:hypothetical protein
MTTHRSALSVPRVGFAAWALCFVLPAALAQTTTPKPGAAAKKPVVASKPAEIVPAPASADQIDAAGQVFYGVYECEFNQTVNIQANLKYPSYVDVKHGQSDYLMKPVESSTGAIRLEDVRGEALMVQISSKSTLLNVKTGRRLVDDCVSPKQREMVAAARAAKADPTATPAATMLASQPAK